MTNPIHLPPDKFRGRHVFVAGGSSGINFGIAQAFARAGAKLSVISRSVDKVAGAVAALQALGAEAQGQSADVRQPDALHAAFSAAVARFGPRGDDALEAMAERVPLKRLGTVDDIARMPMLLASDWGSYITGAVIPVDGGLGLTGPRDFSTAAAASARSRA